MSSTSATTATTASSVSPLDPGIRLVEETPWRHRIDRTGRMRVPGLVFASRRLLPEVTGDRALEQVVNVATLPGIVRASFAMPDIHGGYGFPIGGVAATDVAAGGVVSPGGVGFDISCGVRLLAAPDLDADGLRPRLARLMDELDRTVPRGPGPGGLWDLRDTRRLGDVLVAGARFAVHQGHGVPRDLERCEDRGAVDGADPDQVSERAEQRAPARSVASGPATTSSRSRSSTRCTTTSRLVCSVCASTVSA